MEGVDVDVVRPHFQGDRAREPSQSPLGGGVRRAVLVAPQPRGAADVDHLAVLPRDHSREDVLGGQERAEDIGLEDEAEVVDLDLLHGRLDGAGDAGGVDEDVDAPVGLQRLRHHTLDGRLVRHVRGNHERPAPLRLDLPLELLEGRDIARGQRQVRSFARQGQADVPAHALGGAGDEGDAILEPHAT